MRTLHIKPDQLQTRQSDDGTAEIEGLAVPWATRIEYAGVMEEFARGAISPDAAVGTVVLDHHKRDTPIGVITAAQDTEEGLTITARITSAPDGRSVSQKIRDGIPMGLSVGFQPTQTRQASHGLVYERADLVELSAVALAAYKDAKITAIREEEAPMNEEPKTEAREAPAVDLTPVNDRISQLEARMVEAVQPRARTEERLPVREVFTRMIADYGTDRSKIAQRADMVSSGNTGLTDVGRTSTEIIDYFDGYRYFLSQVVKLPFPESGIVHRLPKKTQNSLIGQAAEKAEAPSRTLLTTVDEFTGEWYKGFLDISYELIRTSSPGAVQLAVEDMLQQAAYESEVTFVAAVEAASTLFPGGPLDFTDAGTLGAGVRSAVRALRAAAGRGTPKFALTSDSFDSLLLMTDGDGRRLFSTVGATNADGSSDLVADMVSAFGVMFFDSPNSSEDIAFNDNSLQASELPPLQLSADNVPNIGRDVGLLGNIITVPRVPAGVLRLGSA